MGWVVNARPRPLHPRDRPGTLCIGGWVGPRADRDIPPLWFRPGTVRIQGKATLLEPAYSGFLPYKKVTWITRTIKCTINVQTNAQYLVSVCSGVILHLSQQRRIRKALPPLHWRQPSIITVMASTDFSTRIALMIATGNVKFTLTI